jgi:hypothetical protein
VGEEKRGLEGEQVVGDSPDSTDDKDALVA